MKKWLFFLLFLAPCFRSWSYFESTKTYNSVSKDITVTVGQSIVINPVSDIGMSWSDALGCPTSASYTVSDNAAFAITPTKKRTSWNWYKVNNSTEGYYYTYNLVANKLGTFTFTGRVYYIYQTTRDGTIYTAYTKSTTAVYNITVVDVTSISIPNVLTKNVGDTYTFSPIITDSRAETTLTWLSSNTSVATIDANGTMTVIGVGTTIITCTAQNGVSAQCVVTVNPILATGISLDKTSEEMVTGETMQLAANISPANTTNPAVTWSSTNNSVALVDGCGLVTAVSPGTCNITATTADGSNLSASCQIYVLGDVLYADDAAAVPSGTFVLPIQLKNESPVTGLQFELQLPEGVTVAEDNAGKLNATLSERAADQSISASLLSNGNYQFVVFSGTSSAFASKEGAIAHVTLNVNEDMPVGEYAIGIKEVELTKTDGTSLHQKDLTSKLMLTEAIPGDTNGDGKVTVTDAVGIVNHILHRMPSVFITKAADVNNDGDISISDAVKIVNIILNK